MHLEIVTPEQVLFSNEVESVTVPGLDGEFQLLNQHAAIVSTLVKGDIQLGGNPTIPEKVKSQFVAKNNKLHFSISGGVLELKDNKVIILVD